MNTLWVFGDSFSTPFDSPNLDLWAKEYINWKGYTPKIYSQIIATEIGFNLQTYSLGGIDNYTILEWVCENVDKIKENDILIIGWSSSLRFRIIDDNNNTLSIIPNFSNKNLNISQNTIEQILYNRSIHHLNYEYELYQWTRLINKAVKCKVLHWKWDSLTQYNTIKTESNSTLNDGHYSESGHIELAQHLLKLLNYPIRCNYSNGFITEKRKKIF